MLAALTTILFLTLILAAAAVAAWTIEERGSAVMAALLGRSPAARPRQDVARLRIAGRGAVRQLRSFSVQPQLRAAA